MTLYKPIDVWKRIHATKAIRFRCFQIGEDAAFCVQSADIFSYPVDKDQIAYLEHQYIELFLEESPDKRNTVFPTLEEAIKAHEEEFGEFENE